MKRPPRLLFAIVVAVASLMLGGVIGLPYVVDVDHLRPQVEARLGAALRRQVSVGRVELSLWRGLALRTKSVRIGEPLARPAEGALLLEAGPTTLKVAWLPLLRQDIDVRSIGVSGARVTRDGRALVSGVDLSSRLRVAADGTIEMKGRLTGELSVMTGAPHVRAVYTVRLRDGALEIPALVATVGPLRIEASGRASRAFSTEPQLALEGTAELRRSMVKGRLDVVGKEGHSTASFDVDSPLLDASEIKAALWLFAGNNSAPRAASGLVPSANAAEAIEAADTRSFARVLEAEGSVRASRCLVRGLELTDLSMQVSLLHGVAELDTVTFSLYGGRARGSLTARPFDPRIPFTLDQSASGVAVRPLIAALAPAQTGTVDGTLAVAVRLSGEAGGGAVQATVNGSGSIVIEGGHIAGFDALRQVQQALEIAGATGIAKDETPFDRLSATFDLVEGQATTADLQFRSQDLNGDGAGTVGLGGALKLDVLASFSKTVSDDLVAKTHALSFRQGTDGRLSVPLQIRGTIRSPNIQLDVSKVINEGVLNELKKKGAKSLLKKLLGR